MPRKQIYVRADDERLWERVEQYAKARRMTVSAVIMTALERLLDEESGSGR